MADTYSDQLRIRLQEDGANSSTWGSISNTNFELFESSISGLASLATTGGTYTLSTASGGDDEARHAMLKITGVLVSNSTVVVPSKTKNYIVWNATTGDYTVTIKTAAGTGVFVPRDGALVVFCDGTNVYSADRSAVDSTFTIYDQTDPTKAVAFQVSGITTATTRTLTVPDANITLARTDAAQTFTGTQTIGALVVTTVNGNTVTTGTGTLTLGAGSTLATSATNSVTLTTTGATNVTLPTAGTLATTAQVQNASLTHIPAASVTGTADDVVLAIPSPFTALAIGQSFNFIAEAANTGAMTVSVDGGTTDVPVKKSGTSAMELGDVATGQSVTVVYDGTNFQFSSGAGGGGAKAGGVIYENSLIVTTNYTLSTAKNGFSVGPITVNGGVAVTIPSGQRWLVL